MTASKKINLAVIGLGWVATNRHIPIILRQPQLNFYGVIDKRPERIQRLAEKFPEIKTSISTSGEMPWGDEVQAVLIATDPLTHFPLARQALLNGKHVLMEKPFTMTPAESEELQEMAARNGRVCCVVHNFQFARSTLKLQALIRSGLLGELQSIEAVQFSNPRRRLPAWYEQLPCGLFYDESPHMFYMLEALAGQMMQPVASTLVGRAGQNTPVSVSAQYQVGGLPIRLNMNFEAALSEWHITVMGTKGVGIVDLFRDILVTLPNDGGHGAREILASSGAVIASHLAGFAASGLLLARGQLFYGADLVWKKFIHVLQSGESAGQISAASGARVVAMQHQLMGQSARFELPAHAHHDI